LLLVLRSLPLLASALVFAGAWIVIWSLMRRPSRRVVLEAFFAGYLGALLYVVYALPVRVSPAEATSIWPAVNLVPLHTMLGIIREHPGMITWQLLGNVILFVPLGLLLPLLGRRFQRFGFTAIVGLSVSVGIEFVQFAMLLTLTARRSVDVDDILLNLAGACIGYLVWRSGHALMRSDGHRPETVEDAV
jgi:glycopeptide antibiotics resistance protein